MREVLSYNDVLILPRFSTIKSRKDVNTNSLVLGHHIKSGIISSNMDTIASPLMARTLIQEGYGSVLHRFQSIEDNVKMLLESIVVIDEDNDELLTPWVSVGVGPNELERAKALIDAGADVLVLDIAHGASMNAVAQVKAIRDLPNRAGQYIGIIAGNFATGNDIKTFEYRLGSYKVDGYKVGVGSGSMCQTRIVTGCGLPTLASIIDCRAATKLPLIADGGIKNSGDIAKSLAAGADAVMIGSLLAGTDETPGEIVWTNWKPTSGYKDTLLPNERWQNDGIFTYVEIATEGFKHYRGSASKESYEVQGKTSSHRTPEGQSSLVHYKGPVLEVLDGLDAGLRSAMSYVNAHTIEEFKAYAELVKITGNGYNESLPFGSKE